MTNKIYAGRQVACPIHGARFDLKTGAAKSPPAFTSLMTFVVRILDGRVEIALPATSAAPDNGLPGEKLLARILIVSARMMVLKKERHYAVDECKAAQLTPADLHVGHLAGHPTT